MNPPAAPEAAATPPSSPAACPDPSKPIDVRELCREAATPGLSSAPRHVPNDVHAILRENLARENAAGANDVRPRPRRKSRRLRDYLVLMIGLNGALAYRAVTAQHQGDVAGFVSSIAGIGLISAALTWVMWFVMERY